MKEFSWHGSEEAVGGGAVPGESSFTFLQTFLLTDIWSLEIWGGGRGDRGR